MFTRNNRSKNKQTLFLTTILLLLSLPGFCQVTWLTSNGTSWLTGSNWTGGVIPTATDVAQFNTNPVSATTGVGINMDTASGTLTVGALYVDVSRTNNLLIGNSATGTPGILSFNGATVNSIPNVLIGNLAANFSKLTIQNTQGAGTQALGLNFGSVGGNIITGAGNSTTLGNAINITSAISASGAITFLGGGTWDATTATGNNGGILRLGAANTFSGGLAVGNNSGGSSGVLELDVPAAISNTTGNNITINPNSQLYLAAPMGTNFVTSNITLNLSGNGNGYAATGKGALVNLSGSNYTWGGSINLTGTAGITVLGAVTNTLTASGNITGSGQLLKQGTGNLELSGTGNTWSGGTQINTGKIIVDASSALSNGPLLMAQVSQNTALTLYNALQNISSLSSSFIGTNNSNTITLNGTRLVITQNTNTVFGGANGNLSSTITGTGSVLKLGSGRVTFTSVSNTFSGGLNISAGEVRFNPTSLTALTNTSPDTLGGGTLSTDSISRGFTFNYGTLALTANSTISLGVDTLHSVKFAFSNGIAWTPGKILTITNWRGAWDGTLGTRGKIFFGSNATGLTAAQVAQIRFLDTSGNIYSATLTGSGELVPTAPVITTGAATYGPFCNNINNPMSVTFSATGPFTGSFLVQLSNASGVFTNDFVTNIIGSGATSPINATIPSGTPAGTLYRLRVINQFPTPTFGSNNGNNIVENGIPPVAVISGPAIVPLGGTVPLTDASTPGVWSSATPAIVTVNTSGTVTGLAIGTGVISYAYTNFCGFTGYASKSLTVAAIPSITSVTPNTAIPGATLAITGNNFNTTAASNSVYFGGVRTISTASTGNSLTVVVPVNAQYATLSITDTTTGFSARERSAFIPTYDNTGLIPGGINFKPPFSLTSGNTPVGTSIADLDGDGRPDLVVVNSGPNNIYLYRNISAAGALNAGSFNAPVTYPTGTGPHYIKIADLDGDGRPEIVVTNTASGTFSVYKNTSVPGTISFASKVDFSAGSGIIDVAIADIDGDGKQDIISVAQSSNKIYILRNATALGTINSASFPTNFSYNTGNLPFRIFAGDLDGDGKPDLAVTNYFSNTVSVFHNSAVAGVINAASLGNPVSLVTGNSPTGIAGGDIDGDGKADLVVANLTDSCISIFRNTNSSAGVLSFSSRVNFATDSLPEDLTLADADGDGKPDIAVGNYGVNMVSLFRNTATSGAIAAGSLAVKKDYTTGINPAGIAWGDLDSDGKPDLVVANGGSSSVSVYKNYPLPPVGVTTGVDSICLGSSTTLSNSVPGGTWVSRNPLVATVSSAGVVTSLAHGIDTISYYRVAQGDTNVADFILTVDLFTTVGSISASGTTVCAGASASLSDPVTGGIWTSNNTTVATVDSTGFLTAHTTGSATIRYAINTSCGTSSDSVHITVVSAGGYTIGSISGLSHVCKGSTLTLTDTSAGGHWSLDDTTVAVVNPVTGIVTGLSYGSGTVTYSKANACGIYRAFAPVSVDTLLDSSVITGADSICQGVAVSFTDAAGSGGTWFSSNFVATVSATGVVSGINPGIDTITYTIANVCGSSSGTKTILVKPAPNAGAITGLTSVCPAASISLSDTVAGGVWGKTNTKASISATGVVTGSVAGIDTITYIVTNSCGRDTATAPITIKPSPNAGIISGLTSVCAGSLITLRDTTSGGVWSAVTGKVTVADSVVTGVSAGIDTVKFAVTNSCGTAVASKTITVVAVSPVDTIAGPSLVCTGGVITLTNAVDSGTWSKTNAKANVSITGVVTGVTAGVDTIKYTAKGACPMVALKAVTINQAPSAGIITGASSVCAGDTLIIKDSVTGGIWSSTNVNSTFTDTIFAAIRPGVDTVKYTVTSACGSTTLIKKITINPLPYAAHITGVASLYVGDIVALHDSTSGGVWSVAGKNALISVDGKVGGLKAGADTIKYSVTNVCGTYISRFPITVLSSDNPGTIVGIQLYPSPNNGQFTINVESKINESISVVIANPAYQVMSITSATTNNNIVMNADLADGVYFLSAISTQGWFTIRFVVAK